MNTIHLIFEATADVLVKDVFYLYVATNPIAFINIVNLLSQSTTFEGA